MGLMDSLRKAEEHSREVARRSLEKAREEWDGAERRIRRKMRIHPPAKKRKAIAAAAPVSAASSVRERKSEQQPATEPREDAA